MARFAASRMTIAFIAFAAIVALVGAVTFGQLLDRYGDTQTGLDRGPRATPNEPVVENEDNPEAEEQAEEAEAHAEHFEAAVRDGKAGVAQPSTLAAAAGWAGEQLVSAASDDWEPAIAADPRTYADGKSYVYYLVTRYASTKPCPGNCPTPYMALYTSTNGGASFDAGKPLCACKGSGQFDPIIEVVPGTGDVYAAYMNGYNVMFIKSTTHGATWGAPVKTYGNVSWNDKPTLAVSDNGVDVYVSFNGPTGGDPWMAQSHDSGATWTQKKLVDGPFYYFDFDSDVAADVNGTVYFAETAILYGGGGNKGTTPTAQIEEHVFISRDRGATWENKTIATVQPGTSCTAAGCPPDFYLGHIALSADGNGNLVALYDGATVAGGPQSIYSRRSTDQGRTWSAATVLSAAGETSDAPAIESRGAGDVRAWYYQTAGGGNVDQWNVWYRTSTDGGLNWTAAVKISDATSGASYKTANGFAEVYGDYGEMAITNAGKSIGIWGEGASYDGPGGVWFNRQT